MAARLRRAPGATSSPAPPSPSTGRTVSRGGRRLRTDRYRRQSAARTHDAGGGWLVCTSPVPPRSAGTIVAVFIGADRMPTSSPARRRAWSAVARSRRGWLLRADRHRRQPRGWPQAIRRGRGLHRHRHRGHVRPHLQAHRRGRFLRADRHRGRAHLRAGRGLCHLRGGRRLCRHRHRRHAADRPPPRRRGRWLRHHRHPSRSSRRRGAAA